MTAIVPEVGVQFTDDAVASIVYVNVWLLFVPPSAQVAVIVPGPEMALAVKVGLTVAVDAGVRPEAVQWTAVVTALPAVKVQGTACPAPIVPPLGEQLTFDELPLIV